MLKRDFPAHLSTVAVPFSILSTPGNQGTFVNYAIKNAIVNDDRTSRSDKAPGSDDPGAYFFVWFQELEKAREIYLISTPC